MCVALDFTILFNDIHRNSSVSSKSKSISKYSKGYSKNCCFFHKLRTIFVFRYLRRPLTECLLLANSGLVTCVVNCAMLANSGDN